MPKDNIKIVTAPNVVSVEVLIGGGACGDGRQYFRERFGTGEVDVDELIDMIIERDGGRRRVLQIPVH